ncbi:MAG: inactive transglutaminase family protein [Gammaproteobacteria bacterium]|uniref:inactive transglutaminase family protein n=1 Tax=Pseudomaricurvus alcaniphilus TaxID=1166482 RepID=UPI00140A1C09|nr:inactive transglutaminase family protein [Pseudomaricurvus alcaniphilus]MBR9909597.1 inactive transglutaminase family protein [Gammaproteobacteria bacterium]NHN36987.1 inactive transglutaminase family protein [Pseudomaricurvus alcaniphilus]
MNSRIPFYALVFTLMATGVTMIIYRHLQANVPLLPSEKQILWDIEATVIFDARNAPAQVTLSRPLGQGNYTIVDEITASPGFGLTLAEDENWPRAVWTKRQPSGEQRLYYRVIARHNSSATAPTANIPAPLNNRIWSEPNLTAANDLILKAWQLSADPYSFTTELLKMINADAANQNVRLLLNSSESKGELAVQLLNQAQVSARLVSVLRLEDGRRRQSPERFIKVWTGDKSQLFNPATGERGLPDRAILWEGRGHPILQVDGGRNSKVEFSIIKRVEPAATSYAYHNANLLNFSIGSLPLAEQALFKTILLLPIGALVVVFLRIFIGIKTSGTFMPVLIALAFMETTLIVGLVSFVAVVAIGLFFRSYLSHLNLLLVARISAVIIMVIAIITLFSILSFQLGLTEGLKVTFFPMIILAWTIERMSILWEEEGAKDVLVQGGGSLLVAVLAYLLMSNDVIRHIAFNFLGLQLVIMSFVLLMGNYSGYRLLELRRFKPLLEK